MKEFAGENQKVVKPKEVKEKKEINETNKEADVKQE